MNDYTCYTLDALLTLQERMERNGTIDSPAYRSLVSELNRRYKGAH